jgi:ParB-like chromosome segregation protein Spo0J
MASEREWKDAGDSQRIPLADIDPEDERFRITTRRGSDDLQPSIRRFGLQRAALIAQADDGYIIVSGFRRVDACRRLGWDALPARILRRAASGYECALRAVADNSLERQLNLIETSRALHLLAQHTPGGRILREDASALGLPTHADMASRLAPLCRAATDIQDAVLSGALSFAMACELGRLEAGLGAAFARLFSQFKPSLSKQREIVTLVSEIACRDGVDPRQVLEEAGLALAASPGNQDRNQQTQRLRRWLRQRRFPALAAAEDHFVALRQRLKLGEALQLAPPRDFEGARFALTLNFDNLEEVAHLRLKLDELIDHPDFKTLLTGKGTGFARTSGS